MLQNDFGTGRRQTSDHDSDQKSPMAQTEHKLLRYD